MDDSSNNKDKNVDNKKTEQSTKLTNLKSNAKWIVGGAVLTTGGAIVLPTALAVLGFTSGGIVASSAAASMMAAVSGSSVGIAGVGVLQSIGAAGIGTTGQVIAGITGAVLGRKGKTLFNRKPKQKPLLKSKI